MTININLHVDGLGIDHISEKRLQKVMTGLDDAMFIPLHTAIYTKKGQLYNQIKLGADVDGSYHFHVTLVNGPVVVPAEDGALVFYTVPTEMGYLVNFVPAAISASTSATADSTNSGASSGSSSGEASHTHNGANSNTHDYSSYSHLYGDVDNSIAPPTFHHGYIDQYFVPLPQSAVPGHTDLASQHVGFSPLLDLGSPQQSTMCIVAGFLILIGAAALGMFSGGGADAFGGLGSHMP